MADIEDVQDARRLNVTNCDELLQSADEYCAFDSSSVKEFTEEFKKTGELTIAFWVKPLNEKALYADGEHIPAISFLSSISPPTAHFQAYQATTALTTGCVFQWILLME